MGDAGSRPDEFGQQPTMPLRSFENPGPPNFGLPSSAPFTVEGQIEREVALLAGAKRARGWRKWFIYTFVAIAALLLASGVVAGLVAAFTGP